MYKRTAQSQIFAPLQIFCSTRCRYRYKSLKHGRHGRYLTIWHPIPEISLIFGALTSSRQDADGRFELFLWASDRRHTSRFKRTKHIIDSGMMGNLTSTPHIIKSMMLMLVNWRPAITTLLTFIPHIQREISREWKCTVFKKRPDIDFSQSLQPETGLSWLQG